MNRRTFCQASLAGLAAAGAARADDAPARHKLAKADVEEMMKSLSNWGRWGKGDQLGTLNLITPAKRKQAAALVREGVPVSLAHDVIKEPTDGSAPFIHRMVSLPKPDVEASFASDEYAVNYHGFAHTHMDALCHFIYRGKLYNGFSQAEVTGAGSRKLGIGNVKNGIFTRGVLMDIPRLLDVRFLEGGRAIYPEDLDAWEKKAGVRVGRGDAVLFRTGRWARRQIEGPWDIQKGSSGLHASCLPWIKRRDAAVVGSDLAMDVMPSQIEGLDFPVHLVLLGAMGTPILDVLDLEKVAEAAAARKRWDFLLTAAPLAVEGGTGSPLNPVAVF